MVNIILFQDKNTKDKDKWFVFSTSLPKTKTTVQKIKNDFKNRRVILVKKL